LQFGVIFPNYGNYCTLSLIRSVAELADSYFDTILSWDHVLYPHNNQTLDVFELLSFIAGLTEKVRLGTCVTPLPLRGSLSVAKSISSLDIISNGRAILGIGAGWYKKEFDLFGSWKNASLRVNMVRTGLQEIRSLLTNPKISNQAFFKCVQSPYPPIWIGTKRPSMIDVAATLGDGWIPSNLETSEYYKTVQEIRSIRRSRKLSDKKFTYGYHLSGMRSTSSYIKKIDDLQNVGCKFIAVYPSGNSEKYFERLRAFVKDVIPSFKMDGTSH